MNETTIETIAGSAVSRVADLNELAASDLSAAQDAAWAWVQDLADGAASDADAHAELLALFATCAAAEPADGRSDGRLLCWVDQNDLGIARPLFSLVKTYVAAAGAPWLGKKYDRANQRGTNTLPRSADLLTRALTPGYRLRKAGNHYEGFEMLTRVENSVLVPGTEVLVLDFATIGTNPWPIRIIRDEVVQVVPGVHLGTKTLNLNGGFQQVAWWATRHEVR